MSTRSFAPTSFAIDANAGKSSVREYALAPAMITFGFTSRAIERTRSMSMRSVPFSTP
jgi:hypothetical protein